MFAVMKELVQQKYTRLIYPEHPRGIDYDRERPAVPSPVSGRRRLRRLRVQRRLHSRDAAGRNRSKPMKRHRTTDRRRLRHRRRRGDAARDRSRAAVHPDQGPDGRVHGAEPVRAVPRRPAQSAGCADRADARAVGRGSVRDPAGQGFPQPVRGRVPGSSPGQEAGRPRLHPAVHAAPSGSRRRGQRQGAGRRPRPHEQPDGDRHAAAGRRAGGGSVRPGRGGHDCRRQPFLLHHESHEGRGPGGGRRHPGPGGHFTAWTCRPTSGVRIPARSAM